MLTVLRAGSGYRTSRISRFHGGVHRQPRCRCTQKEIARFTREGLAFRGVLSRQNVRDVSAGRIHRRLARCPPDQASQDVGPSSRRSWRRCGDPPYRHPRARSREDAHEAGARRVAPGSLTGWLMPGIPSRGGRDQEELGAERGERRLRRWTERSLTWVARTASIEYDSSIGPCRHRRRDGAFGRQTVQSVPALRQQYPSNL